MKKFHQTIGFCLLLMLISGNGIAQKVNYTTNSGIILGIGGGENHQNSDIANSEGLAVDLTLGSHLIKKENAWLSADWKFRFLAGENTAFDHRINADNTYSNILYSFSSYDLELGVTLNRLRERTRIIVTGFAGVGLTSGQTFTDLYDSGNNPYDFSGIDPNRDKQAIYDDLVLLSDGDFETELTGGNAFLPTAGFFLGYQISPAVSLGFEYKTNFYLSEENSGTGINLDNRILTGSSKDRNSYLNVSLYWALKPGSINTGGLPANLNTPVTSNITNNNQVQTRLPGPTVNITQPSDEVTSTSTASQTIEATISNVTDAGNVSFFQNGYPNNSFAFNPATKTFTASVRLREGENSFRIKATNRVSNAEDRVQIILAEPREEQQAAPYLSFTSPNRSNNVSDKELVDLTATVKNISRKEDIQLTLNGGLIPFQYDPVSGLVTATTKLTVGESRFRISGRNEAGSAADQISVNFSAPNDIPPPVISFINPPRPVTVQNSRFPLEAEIQHVENRNDITVLRNGEQTGYFSFRPNGVISPMIELSEGNNIIEITAVNAAGTVTNSTSIYYNEPSEKILPPEITIYYPEKTPLQTDRPTEELRASVRNITSKDQLKVYLNGYESRNFIYNNSTKELSLNVQLTEGNNVVSVEARNGAGSDLDEQVFILIPQVIIVPCDPPEITFYIEETGISGATHVLKGTVTNMRSRTGITFTLDGRPFNEYEYFPSTGIISAKFQLAPGSHRIAATVRNECGDDRFARGIEIEKPCIPPDIQFSLVPVSSPRATHVLQGNASHVENKADVSMNVDGSSFDRFQYMPSSGTLRGTFNFGPGTHKVVTTVQNECGTASKTESVIVQQKEVVEEAIEDAIVEVEEEVVEEEVVEETIEEVVEEAEEVIVEEVLEEVVEEEVVEETIEEVVEEVEEEIVEEEKEEQPCNPPTVNFDLQEVSGQDATHVLAGTASNVKNKSEIKMTLDGNAFNGFQFVPTTGVLSAKFKLEPGTHTVVATVKNECGTDSKTLSVVIQEIVVDDVVVVEAVEDIIEEVEEEEIEEVVEETIEEVVQEEVIQEEVVEEVVEEAEEEIVEEEIVEEVKEEQPCNPPTVNFNLQEVSGQDATHVLAGTASNVKNKSEIKMTLDGNAFNGFQFVPTTGVLSAKFKLEPGTHTVVATVKNECGTDSKSLSVVIQEIVVEDVVVVEEVEDIIEEVEEEEIEEEVEEVVEETIEEVVQEEVIQEEVVEEVAEDTVEDTVEEEEVIVEEDKEEQPCGVRVNPGNSSWQFCLVTAAGTYTRDNIQDNDFSYSGSASSLYFMPIGGGGEVKVNGNPYPLKSGQYYLFSGNIQVTLSTNNPGFTGKWSVCISADQPPLSGTGNNRPDSPCETTSEENKGGKKDKE